MNKGLYTAKVLNCAVVCAWLVGLNWQIKLAFLWVVVMLADYITGTVAAMKNKEWSSEVARNGIYHKVGMFSVVCAAICLDYCIALAAKNLGIAIPWNYCLFALVLVWYIITELGSIMENAVKMGAPVPAWLVSMLKITMDKINEKGGE